MLADACLSARKGEEKSFHPCKRPVKLVQAYLSVWKLRYSRNQPSLKGGFNLKKD